MSAPHYTTVLGQNHYSLERVNGMNSISRELAKGTMGTPTRNPDARYKANQLFSAFGLPDEPYQSKGRLGQDVSNRLNSSGIGSKDVGITVAVLPDLYQNHGMNIALYLNK